MVDSRKKDLYIFVVLYLHKIKNVILIIFNFLLLHGFCCCCCYYFIFFSLCGFLNNRIQNYRIEFVDIVCIFTYDPMILDGTRLKQILLHCCFRTIFNDNIITNQLFSISLNIAIVTLIKLFFLLFFFLCIFFIWILSKIYRHIIDL